MRVLIAAFPLHASVLETALKARGWDAIVVDRTKPVSVDGIDCLLFLTAMTDPALVALCNQNKVATVRWWVGSDVLAMYKSCPLYNVIMQTRGKVTKELFGSLALRAEMQPIGFNGDVLPLPSPVFCIGRPPPMPEKKTILCYLPTNPKARHLYGKDEMKLLLKLLPKDWGRMIVVGGGKVEGADNMEKWQDSQMLAKLYKESNILYRPVTHDGDSCMVTEAMSFGRHVLRGVPWPMTYYAPAAEEAKRIIDMLDNTGDIFKVREDVHNQIVASHHPARLTNMLQAVIANAVMIAKDRQRSCSLIYEGQSKIYMAKSLWLQPPIQSHPM